MPLGSCDRCLHRSSGNALDEESFLVIVPTRITVELLLDKLGRGMTVGTS